MLDIIILFYIEMRKMHFIELQCEKLKYESECKMKKMQLNEQENEKLMQDLLNQQKELEQRCKELEKQEEQNELERKIFLVEKEKVSIFTPITKTSSRRTIYIHKC